MIIAQVVLEDRPPLQHRGDVLVVYLSPQEVGVRDLEKFAFVAVDDPDMELQLEASDSGILSYPYKVLSLPDADGHRTMLAYCDESHRVNL